MWVLGPGRLCVRSRIVSLCSRWTHSLWSITVGDYKFSSEAENNEGWARGIGSAPSDSTQYVATTIPWSSGHLWLCKYNQNCPSTQGACLPPTPVLEENFLVAWSSLFGVLWRKSWWERELSLSFPGNLQAEGLSSKLSLCVHWNDHLGRPSAGCSSPSYVTSSWSDRMLVTSVSLTHNFWPSWETFWLARNLLTMKSPAWLPRTLRRPWGRSSQASYTSYKVMRTSFIWCCLLLTTFHPEVCE